MRRLTGVLRQNGEIRWRELSWDELRESCACCHAPNIHASFEIRPGDHWYPLCADCADFVRGTLFIAEEHCDHPDVDANPEDREYGSCVDCGR